MDFVILKTIKTTPFSTGSRAYLLITLPVYFIVQIARGKSFKLHCKSSPGISLIVFSRSRMSALTKACGNMRDLETALHLVAILTAWSGSGKPAKAKILFVDLVLDRLLPLEHRDRYRARMHPPAALASWNPLNAVDAGFIFEAFDVRCFNLRKALFKLRAAQSACRIEVTNIALGQFANKLLGISSAFAGANFNDHDKSLF